MGKEKLLKKFIFSILIFILIISICYYYLDKPIAFEMNRINFRKYSFFKWLNQISFICSFTSFVLLITLSLKAILRPLKGPQRSLFLLSSTVATSIFLKDFFKVIFGRTWPDTWFANNPSLIKDQIYGFHFWKWDYAYESFPSGHATVAFCVITFLWILAPKWRWLAVVLALFQTIPLIAFNYHFLGDVIGGAYLGSLCSWIAIRINNTLKAQ